MRKLILIKHAMPILKEGTPSSQWQLSEVGIQKSKILGDLLKEYKFSNIYCSCESKAKHTAEIASKVMGKKIVPSENLHEHVREKNRKIYEREEFEAIIKKFFEAPDSLVYGEETANEAKQRYIAAVEKILEQAPGDEDVVIVSHGTVMTLFIKEKNPAIDSFELWNSLGLPSVVVMDRSTFEVEKIVNV